MALQTRKPTGEAGWPMLIVEGREGTRKTSEALRLSADPRIGASYVIEVGERRVDEYATLGNFDVVEHDDSLGGIVRAIREVMIVPPHEGRPNLLIIDSGTALWDLVKRAAEKIARSSQEARRKLEDDPDAEIPVGHQAWNRAKDPGWWDWMNDMRRWPGVLVLTARSDEVSKFANGKPVTGQTEYRVDLERGTPFIFDATVRMRGTLPALVTTAKSLNFSVPNEGLELPSEHPLGHLVFDLFKAGGDIKLDVGAAKRTLVGLARSLGHVDDEHAKAAALAAWDRAHAGLKEFDHAAMAALVDALEPPKVDEPPVTVPDVAPVPANEPAEPPVSVPEPSPGSSSTAERSEASEPVETITEDDDREAFSSAPQPVVDAAVELVRRMATGDVDAALAERSIPLTGNVQTRRARLAARLVNEQVRSAA